MRAMIIIAYLAPRRRDELQNYPDRREASSHRNAGPTAIRAMLTSDGRVMGWKQAIGT